ncbi:MAG: peptidoglycan-associated lipoprotein Pal [Deferribacteres bacterium]|nr:peptidoglycan-associated lipoprotein Pal [Deferribacteres bacterium]
MKKLFVVLLLVFAVGCSKKYVKAPEEEAVKPAPPPKVETVTPAPEVAEEVPEEQLPVIEEEKIAAEELSPEEKAREVFIDVLFDFDKYDIRPDARPILDAVAAFLNENPDINIIIEGHCDERGTNEYNLALGERRAKSTKNYLVSLGVAPSRIMTITYGEEKPVCTQHNEACWQRNRRAHFVVAK